MLTKKELRFTVTVRLPEDEVEECIAALLEKDFDFFRYLADNKAEIYPQGLAAVEVSKLRREWKGLHRGEFGGD
jgi:hypothetical protein